MSDGENKFYRTDKTYNTDMTDSTDQPDKLEFTPEVCREMYALLDHIEDVMDDSSGCGKIPVEKIREVLKKARGEK